MDENELRDAMGRRFEQHGVVTPPISFWTDIRQKRRLFLAQVTVGILGSVALLGWAAGSVWPMLDAQPSAPAAVAGTDGDEGHVYAAAIEHALSNHPAESQGQVPEVNRMFILDGEVANAASPEVERDPESSFPAQVKEDLRNHFDETKISFLDQREDALSDDRSVDRGGIIVALGPITEDGEQAKVELNFFVNPESALWATYVLERTNSTWEVIGTEGPVISS